MLLIYTQQTHQRIRGKEATGTAEGKGARGVVVVVELVGGGSRDLELVKLVLSMG